VIDDSAGSKSMGVGMRYGVALALVVAVAGCRDDPAPKLTAARVGECLDAAHVLHGPVADAAPPVVRERTAMSASFALVPARPSDNALIVLTDSAQGARDGAKAWFRQDLAQTLRAPGVRIPTNFKPKQSDLFAVSENAIVLWQHFPMEAASKRTILACLQP
jgi:hypothetical protein